MAVSISMKIIQNNQSIENNTSNVTVEVYAHWTRGSYNAQTAADGYPDARGTLSIDDVQYSFYSKFNTDRTTSGSVRIFAKTVNINHNNEGEKVLSCWASYYTGVSSGTVSTTGSLALTTIPRKSVLTASNGTLGTAQTLTVTRKSTLLTHTVRYSCGNASGTICTKSSTTSLSWTPPISLAAQYPNSTSVPVTFTITTYNGDNEIGESSVNITCAIPVSVVPTVTIEVTDYSNHLSKYGAYVQGKSKLRVVATASGAQGSTIKSYKTEVDGKSYTKANITTEVLTGTGNLIVKTTVTDSRGRTATASVTVPVLAYTAPSISGFSVSRCDAGGNASKSGAYLAVRFKAAITALNGKNSAVYTVQYKKTGISYYTTQTLGEYGGKHTVSNGVFVFPAETAYSYDVILTAKDDFTSIPKSGVGSSIKKTWSILKGGLGFAFGKIAEKVNTLDMGWDIELNQNEVLRNGSVAYAPAGYGLGVSTPEKEYSDCNNAVRSGWYKIIGMAANAPWTLSSWMRVDAYNENYLVQTVYNEANGLRVAQRLKQKTFGEWEYINPPMVSGVEYRTTERYEGKAVYVKAINFGALPDTAVATINTGIPAGSTIVDYAVRYVINDEIDTGNVLISGGVPAAYVWVHRSEPTASIRTLKNIGGTTFATITIKYTKD